MWPIVNNMSQKDQKESNDLKKTSEPEPEPVPTLKVDGRRETAKKNLEKARQIRQEQLLKKKEDERKKLKHKGSKAAILHRRSTMENSSEEELTSDSEEEVLFISKKKPPKEKHPDFGEIKDLLTELVSKKKSKQSKQGGGSHISSTSDPAVKLKQEDILSVMKNKIINF